MVPLREMHPMVFQRLSLMAALAAATSLAACGQAEQPKSAAPPADHGVFISSTDCADTGKITLDDCGQAIDSAVAAHTENSAVYKSLRQCEAAEGPERCDKIGEKEYRARVQAFFVTMSTPATAVPLYAPHASTAGFRSPSKQDLSAHDESLHMSQAALSLANENARLPAPDGNHGASLGDAAADIH